MRQPNWITLQRLSYPAGHYWFSTDENPSGPVPGLSTSPLCETTYCPGGPGLQQRRVARALYGLGPVGNGQAAIGLTAAFVVVLAGPDAACAGGITGATTDFNTGLAFLTGLRTGFFATLLAAFAAGFAIFLGADFFLGAGLAFFATAFVTTFFRGFLTGFFTAFLAGFFAAFFAFFLVAICRISFEN